MAYNKLSTEAEDAFREVRKAGAVIRKRYEVEGSKVDEAVLGCMLVAICLRTKPGASLLADFLFDEKDIDRVVEHKTLGNGFIRAVEGHRVTVDFGGDTGEKVIDDSFLERELEI